MSENNKSYRIRTNVGESKTNSDYINLDVNLLQDYDLFEILSLKIGTENLYKFHTSKYGCIVGRVLANGGVGVPNAKISVFIKVENFDLNDSIISYLYPYTSTTTKNSDNIRYNTLTDKKIDDCHQNVGTFPNKRLVLDDDNVIEVYDKYYKYTTSTNGSGDYMIFGVPVGNNILHTDIDLSDIGVLSQKPRDLFYKGYTQTQFENSSMFKSSTDLDNLSQIISQDSSMYVYPFWGDEDENKEQIKITRNDIDVNYKFEPTCIFIGCIVSDEKSNAISKNCIPHERMGKMDRLTTGKGTIEMIRKTMGGNVESKIIQGNELIDGNGTWCYQIPMNLDYVATDEFGNLVPTDNYEKGIPTRTSVRFRISLADYESDHENAHLVKVLVPHNPQLNNKKIEFDYQFGSQTSDESFKDLFWNNVYTVKQFIPRFQKGNRQRNKNFTGFKAVNVNGANNPIPYNNMRINLTFLFVFQCLIFKSVVQIIKFLNKLIYILNSLQSKSSNRLLGFDDGLAYVTLDAGMCPALEGNYMALGAEKDNDKNIIEHTYDAIIGDGFTVTTYNKKDGKEGDDDEKWTGQTENGSITVSDSKSSDGKNGVLSENDKISNNITVEKPDGDTLEEKEEVVKIYNQEDYFVKCVELNFAMEYEVIQFDFYNDWINGMIYIPRWFAEVKMNKDKVYYCGETFDKYRYLTQQCALGFDTNGQVHSGFKTGCNDKKGKTGKQECHKLSGRKQVRIFGGDKGIVKKHTDSKGKNIYYLRPSETISYSGSTGRNNETPFKVNLFSTDIMLLGSVSDCNIYGLPKVNGYTSSTYRMPPPTAEIVSDTQEIGFSYEINEKIDKTKFYGFTKAPASSLTTNNNEDVFSEISGIDWGYNPFTTGDADDTKLIKNQIAGHFLEIGCTFSLSNIKSCVNLQRICELGSSMSQNHYIYNDSNGNYDILSPTGIINKREIVDSGMRSTFATLNSKKLKTKTDNVNNFKKYIFTPYIPNQFMGDLENKIDGFENSFAVLKEYTDDNKYGLIEGQSKSYKLFRFGTTQIRDKFLYVNDNVYYMPQYENSFYFYFGLKDGNTAIDRLYSEYYAECPKVEKKTRVYLFADDFKNNECTIRYNIINFDKVTEIQVICDGVILEYSDTKKEYKINDDGGITVYKTGTYIINFYNYSNKFVSGVITIIDKNAPILDMFCIVSSRNVKNKARFQLSYRNLDVKGDRVYVKINKRYEKLNKNTDYEIDFDKKQLTVFMGDDKTIKPNKSVSKVELTIKLELINDYDKIFSVAKKGIFYS